MDSLFRKIRKYLAFCLILIVAACDTSSEVKRSVFGSAYYPLKVGNNWVYDVKEVKFDTLIQNLSFSYQEKFEVVDSFPNLSNEITYVVYLSTRHDESSPWKYNQTWTARISKYNELLVSEENVTFLEIMLPVSDKLSWRGNKYNTIESTRSNNRVDTYVVDDFLKPYKDFSHSFTVTESDDDNFSYQDLRYSVYAENIGLAYRINKYIEFCDDANCFGLNMRKHEVTKEETLIEYEVQ